MHSSANQFTSVRSAGDVRREFETRGMSIAAWARAHGYSSQLVYQVLSGKKACLRGQCHRIAVQLGMKRGLIASLEDLDERLGPPEPDVNVATTNGRATP